MHISFNEFHIYTADRFDDIIWEIEFRGMQRRVCFAVSYIKQRAFGKLGIITKIFAASKGLIPSGNGNAERITASAYPFGTFRVVVGFRKGVPEFCI